MTVLCRVSVKQFLFGGWASWVIVLLWYEFSFDILVADGASFSVR